tara:strand:- start:3603 stop:3770 length:168 start_codon:yes stop_codon:yes gene_type:complete
MPYKIIQQGKHFRIKNLKTGAVSKNKFKEKKNAQIQLNNRLKFEKRFRSQVKKPD